MYEQFRADPASVNESWREFFEDYRSQVPEPVAARAPLAAPAAAPAADAPPAPPAPSAPVPAAAPATPAAATPATSPAATPATSPDTGSPIRGVGAVIVANMERSLGVPTATSFRNVPAKLLEVNRKVVNGYRSRSGQGKVSFTHLIGYAIVRAIADAVPAMNSSFVEGADGKPRVVRNEHVNM
jgi:2-oxoglutarate decarboxylase